jgi:cysteine desulfurase
VPPRLPNTLSVRFPRVQGGQVLAQAPGIAASTGSACHDGHETASSVVLAMGVAPDEAAGTVRLSLGRSTTAADVAFAAQHLGEAWARCVEGR